MLDLSVSDLGSAPLSAVAQIVFLNIVLSGDNAVIIAMACRALPQRQRLWGVAIGAGLAVLLRIVFTGLITALFALPYLKLAGGLVLLYIAVKLLIPDDPDKNEVEAAAHLWRAVRLVVIADIVMSFDNMLAIVEVARGSLALIAIGLAVSIPLVVAGAALIAALLERLPILIWAGAALLAWVGGKIIFSDPAVSPLFAEIFGEPIAGRLELAAAAAAVVIVLAIGGFWRRRRMAAIRTGTSGRQGR